MHFGADELQGAAMSVPATPIPFPHLLGNMNVAVFLTQVHPVPAQAGLPSLPVGELLR